MPSDVIAWKQNEAIEFQRLADAMLNMMTDEDPTSDEWKALAFVRGVAERSRRHILEEELK